MQGRRYCRARARCVVAVAIGGSRLKTRWSDGTTHVAHEAFAVIVKLVIRGEMGRTALGLFMRDSLVSDTLFAEMGRTEPPEHARLKR
jgi:hypothetical protein